ncbi:hypothetical protein [Nesterenkonia sp. CF4.4]|uniref:hypothetical protein n=1 Tax=Nesterenkonia sp. CF4.4 TaxID=3373079 RepID=UPI003EE4F78F
MTSTFCSTRPRSLGAAATSTRIGSTLALIAMTPLVLMGCAAEDESGESPETSTSEAPASAEPSASPEPTEDDAEIEAEAGDDAGEIPSGEGPGGELPDPDELDLERTEELGAFFSEEEACMSVGTMLDGLQSDMNSGVEEQDVIDEIYSAVEQNYIFVPDELREPLENILVLLDTDVDSLDEESVLVAAEPVAGWLTVGFCDGEYHNQVSGDDA